MPTLVKSWIKISKRIPPYKYVLLSQATFYLTLVVCILLAPASLGANGGISYFGTHHLTETPFIVGILASAYFLWRAGQRLSANDPSGVLVRAFQLIIPGMVGIAIAPAIGSGWLDILHRVFGTLVFVTELVLALWISFVLKKDRFNYLLFSLQLAGGLVAFYYLAPAQGFSIEGQLLFQIAFTTLLFRNLKILLGMETTEPDS